MATDYIKESTADVAALLQRASWETMDEEQRDHVMRQVVLPRWGKTTSDGFELKGTAWAQLLGCTVDTVKGRYKRLTQGQQSTEAGSLAEPTETHKSAIRGANSSINKHPELADRLAGNPHVQEAVYRNFPPEQHDADEFATPRSDLAAEAVIAGLIRKARRSLTDAIAEAKDKTFPSEISDDLRSDLRRVRAAADFLDSALTADVEDFDSGLATLLGDS